LVGVGVVACKDFDLDRRLLTVVFQHDCGVFELREVLDGHHASAERDHGFSYIVEVL